MNKSAILTVRLTEATEADLKAAAVSVGVSVADLVRLAIAGLLAHGYVESPLDAKMPKKLRRIKTP